MKLTIDIPDPIWFALATVAEKREIKVSWLVVHAIRDLLGSEHVRLAAARQRRERVVAMARAGHTDAVICERLGESRDYVGTSRRRAGLRANRPGQAIPDRSAA